MDHLPVNTKIIHVMAKFGTLSPVAGAIMVFISASTAPNWGLSQSLISLASDGFSAVLFNSGLLMTGSLAMIYSAGLFEFTKDDLVGRLGSAAFLVYALCTCAMGIMIVDLGEAYHTLGQTPLPMIPISAALLSINLYRRGLTRYAAPGLVAVIFGVVPWLIGGPVDAVKELVALIPFNLWQLGLGLYLYRIER
jgi:hypothetical membrane protein